MVSVVRIIFEGAATGEEHLGSGETAALVQESGIPGRGRVRKVSPRPDLFHVVRLQLCYCLDALRSNARR